MRLKSVVLPDALDQRVVAPERLGERSSGPLRRVGRRLLGRHAEDLRFESRSHFRCPATPRRIAFDSLQTEFGEPDPPLSDSPSRAAKLCRDVFVLSTLRSSQHDLRPQHQPSRRATKVLDLSNGIPSHDRFNAIFAALNPPSSRSVC